MLMVGRRDSVPQTPYGGLNRLFGLLFHFSNILSVVVRLAENVASR